MENTLAYCAGVIDSDGCITIKKRKAKPVRVGADPRITYQPCVFVRQVEMGAIELLHATFGGSVHKHPPSIPGGRDLFLWEVAHGAASETAKRLMPYLRIKKRQAEIIVEYAESVRRVGFRKPTTWFVHEDGEPMYTAKEAAVCKSVNIRSVQQAIDNKTIPVVRKPDTTKPRGYVVLIPKRFWDAYSMTNSFRTLPLEYVAWRDRLTAGIRSLNGPTRGIKSADRVPVPV